ncbi:hypothetical protein G7Y79_00034g070070 [Physcia stellaris]|nr:hypothetical protein G7Y79_00034g070070 [Physcia stellaris]
MIINLRLLDIYAYTIRRSLGVEQAFSPAPREESENEADGRPAPERVSTPPRDPPPSRPVPSSIPRAATDPAQPRQPEVVKEWEAIFHMNGRRGLQQAFYAYAKAQLRDANTQEEWRVIESNASWNHLLRDEKDGTNHVLTLLHTLPDFMILTLLRGELAYRCESDAKVATYVKEHMSLNLGPGIYLNILHDHDGRWLSSKEMSTVLDTLDAYVDGDGSGSPTTLQMQIDQAIYPWPRVGNKVRWLTSEPAPIVLKDWIKSARETYCSNVADQTERFISCPTEVGWAANVDDRCKRHLKNTGTTYIFGLLQAVLRSPPPIGPAFPPPLQVLLFPLWERNEVLCRVGEIVGSLLCHSYWYLGGYNPSFAGCFQWDDDTASLQDVTPPQSTRAIWINSLRVMWSRLEFDKPLLEDILKRHDWSQDEKREKWGQLNAVNKERDELEAERRKLQAEADVNLNVSSTQRDREVAEALKGLSLVQKKLDNVVSDNKEWRKHFAGSEKP